MSERHVYPTEGKKKRYWIIVGGLVAVGGVLAYVLPQPDHLQNSASAPSDEAEAAPMFGLGLAGGNRADASNDAAKRNATSGEPPGDGIGAAQLQVFENIKLRLYHPSFRHTGTAQQLLDMPEVQGLPKELQRQLLAEVLEMLRNGQLDPKQFWDEIESGNPNSGGTLQTAAAPVEPAPTPEQVQAAHNLKARLHDPGFTRTLTMQELQALPEAKDLPSALRQEVVTEVMAMLERGELDPKKFFGSSPQPDR